MQKLCALVVSHLQSCLKRHLVEFYCPRVKVMFSQACVIPSTWGVWVWGVWSLYTIPSIPHPYPSTQHNPSIPPLYLIPASSTPHPCPSIPHPLQYGNMVNVLVVRILLECILVINTLKYPLRMKFSSYCKKTVKSRLFWILPVMRVYVIWYAVYCFIVIKIKRLIRLRTANISFTQETW